MAEEKKAVAAKAENKPEKKPAKKDKPSIGSRIAKFFRDYKSELKKITWASREQTMRSSIFVIVTVVISAAAIGLLDIAFSKSIQALANIL